ncbi:MAG: hypothetical protein ACI9GO_000469 [Bacteroidia bacterium]|jgi:hypothetical protein
MQVKVDNPDHYISHIAKERQVIFTQLGKAAKDTMLS